MSKQSGHAVVEFALVFPVFVLMCVVAFQIIFLAVQQFGWHRLCTRTARLLSFAPVTTQNELLAEARRLLSPYEPLHIIVGLQTVPIHPSQNPYRKAKHVELLDLTIEKEKKPFRLTSSVREVRVR